MNSSVWHIPVALISTITSPALGPSRVSVSILKGFPAVVANAAGTENLIAADEDGGVDLYYDNSKKLETTSYGAKVTGRLAATTSLTGADSVKLILGDGDDLQLFHDGSNSYIDENGSGDFKIRTRNGNGIQLISSTSENMITCQTDGAVELYYCLLYTSPSPRDS